jgi:hypothetical protein
VLEKTKHHQACSESDEEKHIAEQEAFLSHEPGRPIQKNSDQLASQSVEAQEESEQKGKTDENEPQGIFEGRAYCCEVAEQNHNP